MNSLYAEKLTECLPIVIQQSIDQRSFIEQFIICIKNRILAEEKYAKDLTNIQEYLSKQLSKSGLWKGQQLNSIGFLFAALKSDATRRAFQIKSFAEQLKDQILNPTQDLSLAQLNQFKKLQKDGKYIDKQNKQLQEKITSSKAKLAKIDKQLEQQTLKNEIMSARCIFSSQQKNRQKGRLWDLKQQQQLTFNNYKSITQQYNTFTSNSRHQLSLILSKFQQQYMQRIQKMVDNLKKLMIFETAMMRNFDYDIININRQVESVNSRKDIIDFVQLNKQIKKVVKVEPINRQFMESLIEQLENNQFQKKIMFQKNEQIREFIQDHIKDIKDTSIKQIQGYYSTSYDQFKQIIMIVDSCWKDNKQIDQNVINQFRKLIETDENRYLFHRAFKQYNAYFNKDMRKETVTLFSIIVEKSIQRKDIYTIRKLLAVVFSKWMTKQPNSKPKQLVLYRAIQGDQLWKNQDFWDAAIFESIQQKLKGLVVQKGETLQQTKMKQQNVVLSQLASYCHIMIMLGASQKNVKLNVGKYCRLHNLGQNENKVLSKSISQTLITYKEFN